MKKINDLDTGGHHQSYCYVTKKRISWPFDNPSKVQGNESLAEIAFAIENIWRMFHQKTHIWTGINLIWEKFIRVYIC